MILQGDKQEVRISGTALYRRLSKLRHRHVLVVLLCFPLPNPLAGRLIALLVFESIFNTSHNMLGKIFRSRRSSATPSPQFETGPTLSRSTPSKPPSKLLTKLKELKNAIRSGTSSKKVSGITSNRAPNTQNSTKVTYDARVLTRQGISPRKNVRNRPGLTR